MNAKSMENLIQNLSNHFEMFFSVMIIVGLFFLVLFVSLRIKYISLKNVFRTVFDNLLFLAAVTGQAMLVLMVLVLFWANYTQPPPSFRFPEDVIATTRWVQDDLRIYFVGDKNQLRSIRLDGREGEDVFTAPSAVTGYYFAPDGHALLVTTKEDLYYVDIASKQSRLIDSVRGLESSQELKGALGGIRWSPDSRKFCYELGRWSQYSSQDNLYIYDLIGDIKRPIKTPTRRISALYWGRDGRNLYYLRHKAEDPSVHAYSFAVQVFRIPLDSLEPELIEEILQEKSDVPIQNLTLRGIDLFLEGDALSFGPVGEKKQLVSEKGPSLGIDEKDVLYYIPNKWFRKRLFKIPREPAISEVSRHPYKGGDLIFDEIRWVPGGRYVIMQHRYLGVMILEPATRKIGFLIEVRGGDFGWYTGAREGEGKGK
jgi:hypothetical protein